MFTTTQVSEITGATVRQLDHWTRTHGLNADASHGSGHKRTWTRTDVYQAAAMTAISNHFGRSQGQAYQDLMHGAAVTDPERWVDGAHVAWSGYLRHSVASTTLALGTIRDATVIRIEELGLA